MKVLSILDAGGSRYIQPPMPASSATIAAETPVRTSAPTVAFLVALAATLLLPSGARAEEVRVAVATNFRATMDALAAAFGARGEHAVIVSAGATGSQYAQIVNGAPFDAFFAADVERPTLLERDGIGVAGTRFVYAVGRLALWSARLSYVDDGGRVLETGAYRHLAIANPDLAPYGAAAREVLRARGLWDDLEKRLVQGQDIGQAYSFVATGNAELGFVALAQLMRPGAKPEGSYWVVPQDLHAPIAQQAILLRDSPAARAFLEFVKSEEARTIVRSYGYGP
jgi:molybdate transport system substrate-binding protein